MERLSLIVMLALVALTNAAPSEYPMDETRAMNYLKAYGFAGSSNPNPRIASLMDENPSQAMEVGLKIFQDKYGLEVTGILDQPTMDLMSVDRCGNKDITTMEDMMPMESMEDGGSRRKKRYLVQGNRWPSDHLTYRITQYPADGDLTRSEVDREVARAFQVWSDVTPLRFSISSGRVDIYITFNAYAHGDGNAFDGPGGVLAHAYLPFSGQDIEGDSHFDESETWTIGTYSGTNLFQVAAHEFGHALGLGHSEVQSALMAPFYRGYIPNFRLPMDDILGIQSLYGQPGTGNGGSDTTTTTRQPVITFPPNMPNFCEDSHVDAFVGHIENGQHKVYAFQGNYFTLIDGSGIVSGYPKNISSEWYGLPNDIDAALYLEEYSRQYYTWSWETYSYTLHTETSPAYTLFFKGSNYYVFTENRTPDGSNPRPISELGMPRDIDSAFVWARNDRIYVTKGTEYYRFTRGANPLLRMDSGYPRALSIWNLPVSTIDGAFKSFGGHNFFFKDQQFYLYDNANVEVAAGYPRSISQYVYGCSRNIEVENENEAGTGSEETDITEDGMSSAADTQTVSYTAFMSTNCLLVLMVLCVL